MTATRSAFDVELDALLSMAPDPVMPVDLARRIVVRTAHLPQCSAAPEWQVSRRGISAPPPRSGRWPGVARRGRVGQVAGGAIAACLLAIVAAAPPDMPAPPQVTGSEAVAEPAMAKLDLGDLPRPLPRAVTRQIEDEPVRLASSEPFVPQEPADTAPSPVADAMPILDEAVQVADADERLPLRSSAIQEFKLARKDEGQPEVYGPVLTPERSHSLAIRPASGGTALGVVGGARAPSGNSPGW